MSDAYVASAAGPLAPVVSDRRVLTAVSVGARVLSVVAVKASRLGSVSAGNG